MSYPKIQGRPAWIGVWRQLLPTTFGCIYKMLVACASDNEEEDSWIKYDNAGEFVNGAARFKYVMTHI